jgi:Recombination endonuclease VII
MTSVTILQQRAKYARKWRAENRDKYNTYQREYRRKQPEKYKIWDRRGHLGRKGWVEADYERLLKKQHGHCALCHRTTGSSGKRLHMDHDHKTGRLRGLLCHPHNIAIGMLGDLPGLRKAIRYLGK